VANLDSIKRDANNNVKILVDYLRRTGLIGDTTSEKLRDYESTQEEILYGQLLAAHDLARRIATL
jgi:hypothetical protein